MSFSAPRRAFRLPRFLKLFAVAYVVLIVMLLFLENRFIFVPSREPRGTWTPPTPGGENVEFSSGDGTRLTGWYLPHPDPAAIVLFANGNGGNMSHWREAYTALHRRCRATVFGFDYRGYGRSDGSPSGAGVSADARAARAWLAARTGVAEDRIVLMGRSLGGGVACDLSRDGARALVVESSFTSLPDVAARLFPFRLLPVRYVMRTRFDSLSAVAAFNNPLFVSHGDEDELIPLAMGRALYDAAGSTVKRFYLVRGGRHNDTQPAPYYEELAKFFAELP